MRDPSGHIQTGVKFLVLFGLTLAVYAQTFDDPYHFDDAFYITNNASIRHLADWPATVKAISDFQVSRFVVVWTFAINYYFHQLNVFGYHAVNFLIHFMTVCLVWRMGKILIVLSGSKKSAVFIANKKGISDRGPYLEPGLAHAPYWAALLFAVHPANTQAVVYLSQRCESLAALFYMSAVCFYLQARISKTLWRFIPAVICGLLGMFSKESVITLPLTIIFLEFFFLTQKERFSSKRRWLILICACLIFVVPALLHFNLQQLLFSPIYSQSHPGDVLTLPSYVLTQFRVFVRFLSLVIAPIGMNLDHDFVMSHTLFEPDTFFSFLILIGTLTTAVYARKKAPILTFAIAWFFLVLSANFIPRGNVIFEHKMYLVLAGVLPAVLIYFFDVFKDQRILVTVLSCVVLVFSLLTVQRNSIWRDDIALWTDVISKSPLKARPYNHRGMAFYKLGMTKEALNDLDRAIELRPGYALSRYNRGYIYAKIGQPGQAHIDLSKAIELNPFHIHSLLERGALYSKTGELHKALEDFNSAEKLQPANPAIYNNRGIVYKKLGRWEEALNDYDRALELNPRSASTYVNRARVWQELGNQDESDKDLAEAQKLGIKFDPAKFTQP